MLYAVVREGGESWDYSRSIREQEGWDEHAEFMDALTERGIVVLGGPLGDGKPHKALQIMDVRSAEDIADLLADDPWPQEMLRTASIERWEIFLVGRDTRIGRRTG